MARMRQDAVQLFWLLCGCVVLGLGCSAQAAAGTLYRCTGKTVFFTTDSATASAKGCQALRGTPLIFRPAADTVALRPSPSRAAALSGPSQAPPALAKAPHSAHSAAYVSRDEQAHRDRDRRRILEEELSEEQNKLRNLAESLTRARAQAPAAEVALLSQSSLRSESNVEALRRELSRTSR